MGIFSFVKDAGDKLTSSKDDLKADMIEKKVAEYNVDVENFEVELDDGKAVVKGEAGSMAIREKLILMVGNLNGIESVDDQMTVKVDESAEVVAPDPEPIPETRFYTVVSGDTLSGIAKKMYGDAGKYPEIFEANKPMLKSPDLIYPGQSLRIPEL